VVASLARMVRAPLKLSRKASSTSPTGWASLGPACRAPRRVGSVAAKSSASVVLR
jgi:hypothetical protein